MTDEKTPELEAYISYRLSQLSNTNQHHRFEEIATRIARKRISSNILVANGPVSAGGDQGRDAESYTTRIPDELPHAAGFSASASTAPVVLACTVQKKDLKAKILADLAGICDEEADPVELVAFFSLHSISEGLTHDLKSFARDTYGVTLDVYSGAKIATLLAEPDLTWISQHYLEVPASMIPEFVDTATPDWYVSLRDALRDNDGPAALTPASQGEVTEGLRFAIWDAEANADLPEWIDFMTAFLADDSFDDLRFRACYEISVARFRGMGIATGSEDLIRAAIDLACASLHPNILDDAVTLLAYWGTMWASGVGRTSPAEIAVARERLRSHIVDELSGTDATAFPVRSASLTGALALLHLQPRWDEGERHGFAPEPAERAEHVGQKLTDTQFDASFVEESGLFDLGEAMRLLEQLVDLLPSARAYSVSGIAQMFTMFAPALSEHPGYRRVRDALDAAVAAVHGDGAIAEKCRDRGVAFLEAGRPLDALAEFHEAKVRWFHGDSMEGTIIASRFIAGIYRDLGLMYASKMYSANAAVLANMSPDDDVKKHLPRALLALAETAQESGCWSDAAELTEIALLAHGVYETHAFDFEKHPDLEQLSINAALELQAVRAFWPGLEQLLSPPRENSNWSEHVSTLASGSGDEYPFDEAAFQSLARGQFAGPVLSDLGPTRIIDFEALGTRWTFTFENNRATTLAAEGFVAAFQAVLADIARFDPIVVSAHLEVRIRLRDDIPPNEQELSFEDANPFSATLDVAADHNGDFETAARFYVATAGALIDAIHARPSDDLMHHMENLFRDGISHKVIVARPYWEAADLLSDEHFTACSAAERPSSSNGFIPHSHSALAASERTGPDYDRAESLQRISGRYQVGQGWGRSIAHLLQSEESRKALQTLRDEGWLDWQIVATVANAGLNRRVAQLGVDPRTLTPQQVHELATRPEAPTDAPLGVAYFLEHLDMNLHMQDVAVAHRWKLFHPYDRPDLGMLRDLLIRRYDHNRDDIPHTDLLHALDEQNNLRPLLPSR